MVSGGARLGLGGFKTPKRVTYSPLPIVKDTGQEAAGELVQNYPILIVPAVKMCK